MVREFVHESKYDHSWSSCVRAYFLRYPNPSATHILSVDVLDRRIEYRTLSGNQPSIPQVSSPTPSTPSSSPSASSPSTLAAVEAQTTIPVLCTTRLILKRGTLPKWAPAGLIKNAESWVIEESEVELDLFPPRAGTRRESSSPSKGLMGRTKNGRSMRSWTRNIDHTTVLAVTEGLAFKERFGFMDAAGPGKGDDTVKGKSKAKELAIEPVSNPASLQWKAFCKTITTAQIESQIGIGMLRRRIEKFGLDRFVAHKDTPDRIHAVFDTLKQSQQGILWTRDRLDPLYRSPLLASSREDEFKRASIPEKKLKILESLRPPFLDGYPLGPIQKLRLWWWSGHYSQVKTIRDGYPITNDEDEAKDAASDGQADVSVREGRRYRGVPDESVWRNLSGETDRGVVYSEMERSAEGGILNRIRRRLGLKEAKPGPGLLARAKARLRGAAAGGSDDAEKAQAREGTRQQEQIDRQRSV